MALTHADHFIEYDPLVTPPHIVPEWYFLPFYAILRSVVYEGLFAPLFVLEYIGITAKLGGVLAMIGSVVILFVLPWLDKHPVRSARYRPLYRVFFLIWAANVVFLGYLGALTADATLLGISAVLWGQISTVYYFAFFLVILPMLNKVEKPLPLPASISEAVLQERQKKSGAATA
jgi:quinol-cytochrome oxidoreductase complex cytochrome b subunit